MQSHLPKVLTSVKLRIPDSYGGFDAVPPPESSDGWQNDARPRWGRGWGTSVWSCGLACEQFVLLGPVQRQIEFGQPRRGELDGLPALQDRLDQPAPGSRRRGQRDGECSAGKCRHAWPIPAVIGRGRWRAPQTTRAPARSP